MRIRHRSPKCRAWPIAATIGLALVLAWQQRSAASGADVTSPERTAIHFPATGPQEAWRLATGAVALRDVPAPPTANPGDQDRGGANVPPLPPSDRVKIPLASSAPSEAVRVEVHDGRVTIVADDASLSEILTLVARQQGWNIVTAEDIKSRVTTNLCNVPIEDALAGLLSVYGYTSVLQHDILLVTSMTSERKGNPQAQGRKVQVFVLNYTSATEVNSIIKGLLSPLGQSFVTQSKDSDNRKTQEVVVVEDVPWHLERVAETIRQLDVAPRQVLIEAHILDVKLTGDMKHGVNFQALTHGNPAIAFRTDGFANAAQFATPSNNPAFFFNIASQDLNLLLDALQTTADAKTLASPKVFALNGQQARIQIGQQLGFKTLLSSNSGQTMENVQFLNVGVILNVTPQITPDNKVMMKVKPQVSKGDINTTTQLPESDTTEVETSVTLPDGYGIVIGGLIQESDTKDQTKIPFLGDLWLVGKLFQHTEISRSRDEIIISLVPHIMPYQPERQTHEEQDFCRSKTPLLHGSLEQYPRPSEARFPDPSGRQLIWSMDQRRSAHASCGPAPGTMFGGDDRSGPAEPIPAPPPTQTPRSRVDTEDVPTAPLPAAR